MKNKVRFTASRAVSWVCDIFQRARVEAPMTPPDAHAQALREAQAWLRRLSSGAATQHDVEGFRRWRDGNPLHQPALAQARRLWQALDPAIGGMPAEVQRAPILSARPVAARRAFLGAAVGAAGAAGVAVVSPPLGLWPSLGEWNVDYRTATGEQRAVQVAEGVDLMLNTQTSVQRRSVEGRVVGIDLIAGEAAVDLVAGPQPFGIVAGAARSEAQAGRFEVRYLAGRGCVTCLEGRVRVTHAKGTRDLQAGEQVLYDAASLGPVAAVATREASAWRSGVLVFRQTPLAHVIEEINRYRPGRVVLLAQRLAGREVSGRFAIASLDTVLVQIQRSYDLEARALPGGVLLLS